VDELPPAALVAVIATPAEPADRDTVADHETLDAVTDFGNLSRDLMSRSQRPRHPREVTGDKKGIGTAYPAGTDADAYFAARRRRRFNISEL
jgi:hypothetical protein